ncbi:MAG: NAD(P)H-hydrate epimerase [Candidatus Omnitrophica bacterium]|nr:NAD(P)H-hydrate epimerase [Candidatus Omnitrophota bacterium]
MKGLSVSKLRELDDMAKEIGLDERILIENASSNLSKVIDKLNLGKKVLVVAGRGNNGADVLSCARKLFSSGYDVRIAIVSEKELGSEVFFQRKVLEKIGCQVVTFNNNTSEIKKLFEDRDFILEGILGIGIKGELSHFLKEVINLINESGKRVVSCDIPSGLSPDQGIVLGQAIKANYTVSFIAPKIGFYLKQGLDLCGEIFIVDIGISRDVLEELIKREKGKE